MSGKFRYTYSVSVGSDPKLSDHPITLANFDVKMFDMDVSEWSLDRDDLLRVVVSGSYQGYTPMLDSDLEGAMSTLVGAYIKETYGSPPATFSIQRI